MTLHVSMLFLLVYGPFELLKPEKNSYITKICFVKKSIFTDFFNASTCKTDTLGVNEKQFWQMIKPKRTVRSGSHLILNGRLLSSDTDILEMWASHFENLGISSAEPHYDEDFKGYIDGKVKHILQKYLNSSSCIEDIFGFQNVKISIP